MHGLARGKFGGGYITEEPAHLRDGLRGIDVSGYDIDGVVWVIPGMVEVQQLRAVDVAGEIGDGSQRVLRVRRAADKAILHLYEEPIEGVALILLYLLRDRTTLLAPQLLRHQQARRARPFGPKRDVEIGRRHGKVVLRDRRRRICVEVTPRDSDRFHKRRGRKRRASPK